MSIEAMQKACSVMANARDYIGASEPEPWPMEQQYDELQDAINMLARAIKKAEEREWVGLTDEDMEVLFLNEDGVRFARYIEAKLKEKNT
jgi:Ran GTPase-activating protein (RanGAP) involved in mRNA processing and transport